mmetsp:Transcript_21505/g.43148  ORF Transcript_21505/g.43148 Transcript_21505/m.43148 type:complete len:81 (+) Transcript_21505:38-280(+)
MLWGLEGVQHEETKYQQGTNFRETPERHEKLRLLILNICFALDIFEAPSQQVSQTFHISSCDCSNQLFDTHENSSLFGDT